MTDEPHSPLKEERDALERLALTLDGLLLHRYLRRELERMPLDTSHGALAVDFGRRSLAHQLMAVMAEGIEKNRGRHADSAADAPALARPGKPVAVAGSRGAARRVKLSPGDGWSDDTPGTP